MRLLFLELLFFYTKEIGSGKATHSQNSNADALFTISNWSRSPKSINADSVSTSLKLTYPDRAEW